MSRVKWMPLIPECQCKPCMVKAALPEAQFEGVYLWPQRRKERCKAVSDRQDACGSCIRKIKD